jgi:hypothetical protein
MIEASPSDRVSGLRGLSVIDARLAAGLLFLQVATGKDESPILTLPAGK